MKTISQIRLTEILEEVKYIREMAYAAFIKSRQTEKKIDALLNFQNDMDFPVPDNVFFSIRKRRDGEETDA